MAALLRPPVGAGQRAARRAARRCPASRTLGPGRAALPVLPRLGAPRPADRRAGHRPARRSEGAAVPAVEPATVDRCCSTPGRTPTDEQRDAARRPRLAGGRRRARRARDRRRPAGRRPAGRPAGCVGCTRPGRARPGCGAAPSDRVDRLAADGERAPHRLPDLRRQAARAAQVVGLHAVAGELPTQCRHEIVVVELDTRAATDRAGQEDGRHRTAKRWTGPERHRFSSVLCRPPPSSPSSLYRSSLPQVVCSRRPRWARGDRRRYGAAL